MRIINSNNKWVPHVLHIPLNEMRRESVITELKYSITESNKINTIIIMDATQPLNNISILIKNTAVQKFGTLSGSNDKENWFVINDSILLQPEANEKNTESVLNIKFPQSNYSNLKFVINNRNKDPFNIVAVSSSSLADGILFSKFSDSTLQNPTGKLLQKDSAKQSFIKITQPKKFHFNQIDITLEGVRFFNRQVDMFVAEKSSHSFSNPGNFLQSYNISNNSKLHFNLPLQNATNFYLIIRNEDNPALQIKAVSTSLSYRYITCFLEKGNTYKLILDNAKADLPNYDITKDYPTLKASVPLLSNGSIIAYEGTNIKKNDPEKRNQWIIWSVIIVTLCLLLFFTKTMIKEVNKKRLTDDNL